MRIVVIGATGNVGTSVLDALGRDPAVDSVLGIARRLPTLEFPQTEFVSADVTRASTRSSTPAWVARRCKTAIIFGCKSTAITRPEGPTSRARGIVKKPIPGPGSSTVMPS